MGECGPKALSAYVFVRAFVNESAGEFSSSITAGDIAGRFGVSAATVSRAARKRAPAGWVQQLAAAQALVVRPQVAKTRDCAGCGAPKAARCAPGCTETKGRTQSAPRFELARGPAAGFCHPGPISAAEYYQPATIAARLRAEGAEGPEGAWAPQDRGQIFPFAAVPAWVALHPQVTPLDLAIYTFMCAHVLMSQGQLHTQMYRGTIARRFGISESTVSESTARLERLGAIAKSGLASASGRRWGTGEATTYVIRVAPPAGYLHPLPTNAGEWRAPEKITERIDAERSGTTPLHAAHPPIDQGIVDNSVPSTAGGVRSAEGGGALTGDISSNPLHLPLSSPSVGAQPQDVCACGRVRGTESDHGEGEGGEPAAAPPARPVSAGALALARLIPTEVLVRGEDDQLALAERVDAVLAAGTWTLPELRRALARLDSGTGSPYAVAMWRLASDARIRHQLALADGVPAPRPADFDRQDQDAEVEEVEPFGAEWRPQPVCPVHPAVITSADGRCAACEADVEPPPPWHTQQQAPAPVDVLAPAADERHHDDERARQLAALEAMMATRDRTESPAPDSGIRT